MIRKDFLVANCYSSSTAKQTNVVLKELWFKCTGGGCALSISAVGDNQQFINTKATCSTEKKSAHMWD